MCPDLVVGGDVGGGAGAHDAGGHRAVTVTCKYADTDTECVLNVEVACCLF